MKEDIKALHKDVRQLRRSVDTVLKTQKSWANMFARFRWLFETVVLEDGDAHTFHGSPTGHLTISNASADETTLDLAWSGGGDTTQIQPGTARLWEVPAWPVTITNQGPAPVTVTPS